MKGCITKHLESTFGKMDATTIRRRDITGYMDDRLEAGAKSAAVNRELAVLRWSFILGMQEELIEKRPMVESLPEGNARQGFLGAWVNWSRMVIAIPEAVTQNKKRRILPVYVVTQFITRFFP